MSRFTWIATAAVVVAAGLVPVAPAQSVVESASCSATGCPEPPQCRNKHLTASYKAGDSATSHTYGRIVLTNTSSGPCWIRGYGGLSYVGGGDGTQIGAPADRTPGKRRTRLLYPGLKVRSRVVETSAAGYPVKKCKPADVDGFRVYVPDAKKSQYVPHPTTGCQNTAVHLLEHKAYR